MAPVQYLIKSLIIDDRNDIKRIFNRNTPKMPMFHSHTCMVLNLQPVTTARCMFKKSLFNFDRWSIILHLRSRCNLEKSVFNQSMFLKSLEILIRLWHFYQSLNQLKFHTKHGKHNSLQIFGITEILLDSSKRSILDRFPTTQTSRTVPSYKDGVCHFINSPI